MSKRGQATILILLAIIILAVIGLIFFAKSKIYVGGTNIENLQRELDPIIRHVEKCLYDTTSESTYLIAKQGGYIEPKETTYRLYNGQKISYLCYNKPLVKTCSNRYLRISDVEEQLEQTINQKLDSCLNIKSFEKAGYNLIIGNKNIEVDIGTDNVITTLNQQIKLKREDKEAQIEVFKKAVPLPLGRLYSASKDIVNAEATFGLFDPLIYSLAKSKFTAKPYTVQRLQPHPDKLYILKINNIPEENKEFIFQFFIEGEE